MNTSGPSTSGITASADKMSIKDMMLELKQCQYYYGTISNEVAKQLIKERPIGTFILRDSHKDTYLFSITYVSETGVYHSRVAHHGGRFCLGGPHALISANSIVDFVRLVMRSSRQAEHYNIIEQPTLNSTDKVQPVRLLYPLLRKDLLPSLKYLCRIVIRHSLPTTTSITTLPIPKPLQDYVAARDYLYPV